MTDKDKMTVVSASATVTIGSKETKTSSFEIVRSIISPDDDDNDDDNDDKSSTKLLLIDRYDGFLIDQWGVLHNGVKHMPGAPDVIAQLALHHNKKMVIVSNSPSNERATLDALGPLGFEETHFVGAVTSGMLASQYIRKHFFNKKVLLLGWEHPSAPSATAFLDQCGGDDLELVTSVDEDPQAIIVQGNEIILGPLDVNESTSRSNVSLGDFVVTGNTERLDSIVLQSCVKRNLPLICVDPDFVTVNPDGSTYYMPGTVAKRYKELGGHCVYFGKPHGSMFQEGIRRLQQQQEQQQPSNDSVSDRSRIAMIGDSMHHDVAGANAAGIDSILLLGGVHRKELGLGMLGDMASRDRLQALFETHGQIPTIVAPMLK